MQESVEGFSDKHVFNCFAFKLAIHRFDFQIISSLYISDPRYDYINAIRHEVLLLSDWSFGRLSFGLTA